MTIWLHGTLYVTIHEAKDVPLDRRIRLPDKVIPGRDNPLNSGILVHSLASQRSHSPNFARLPLSGLLVVQSCVTVIHNAL